MKAWQKKKEAFERAQIPSVDRDPASSAEPAALTSADVPLPSSGPYKKTSQPRDPGDPPQEPKMRMQPEEVDLFLKLATAIKIFASCSISETQLQRADNLMQEYLIEFKRVSL